MKKGSINTLLVVALVALGMMAFMGFESSSSGAFSAPRPRAPTMGPGPAGPGPAGPGAAIRPPIRVVDRDITIEDDSDEEPVYYTDTSSTSVNDCVIAREIKAVKEKLQMPISDDLINLVNKCNQLNIY